jgi:thioredoxin reductase (NADPH)
MEAHGTKFQRQQVPSEFRKLENGKILVKSKGLLGEQAEEFDTVLMATGRTPLTQALNLPAAGVRVDKASMKVPVDANAQTNIPHIFCIGDAQLGAPELTPTAILSGKILAKHLYRASVEQIKFDIVPTAVFTPLEYGAIGLSEERAREVHGADKVVVYHSEFTPLEWAAVESRPHEGAGFVKIVTLKQTGHKGIRRADGKEEEKKEEKEKEAACGSSSNDPPVIMMGDPDNELVLGLHYLGPNAAEVINGWGPALALSAKKKDFERIAGIHPSCAEEINTTFPIKGTGASAAKSGC